MSYRCFYSRRPSGAPCETDWDGTLFPPELGHAGGRLRISGRCGSKAFISRLLLRLSVYNHVPSYHFVCFLDLAKTPDVTGAQ